MTPNEIKTLESLRRNYEIYFSAFHLKVLRQLSGEINKLDTTAKHCYSKSSSVPSEIIYAEDTDFVTE